MEKYGLGGLAASADAVVAGLGPLAEGLARLPGRAGSCCASWSSSAWTRRRRPRSGRRACARDCWPRLTAGSSSTPRAAVSTSTAPTTARWSAGPRRSSTTERHDQGRRVGPGPQADLVDRGRRAEPQAADRPRQDLVYVYGPALNVQDLADLLRRAGAVEGMQLDINPAWMRFDYYSADGHAEETGPQEPASALPALPLTPARWLRAVVRTTRPRQWPKNLLVFAAPLAGASLGHDLGYALLAMFAFGCASAAVYFVNDFVDVERDRRHPVKRNRPIASGALPERHAAILAVLAAAVAVGAGVVIGEPLLVLVVSLYLCSSFLYSFKLKHVPFVEMVFLASGFLLRVLGGAAATHVKPSIWFLLVCRLGPSAWPWPSDLPS